MALEHRDTGASNAGDRNYDSNTAGWGPASTDARGHLEKFIVRDTDRRVKLR